MRKFPTRFMLWGLTLKAVLVLATHFVYSPFLLNVLITFDPVASAFADWGLSLFSFKGIAPRGAGEVYEVLLVIGFGLQCYLLGYAIQWLYRRSELRPSGSG